MPRKPALTAHLLLIAVTVVWGATFTLVKSAIADVSPLLFNLIRMVLAFAILAAINVRSLRSLSARDLRFGAIARRHAAAHLFRHRVKLVELPTHLLTRTQVEV